MAYTVNLSKIDLERPNFQTDGTGVQSPAGTGLLVSVAYLIPSLTSANSTNQIKGTKLNAPNSVSHQSLTALTKLRAPS